MIEGPHGTPPVGRWRSAYDREPVALRIYGLVLVVMAGLPVLYFLSITVLRSGRKRGREYADFT